MPTPREPSFRMTVQETAQVTGMGTYAAGQIEIGTISIGYSLRIHSRMGFSTRSYVVTSIKIDRQQVEEACKGDRVHIVLRGLQGQDIERGDILTDPTYYPDYPDNSVE